MEINEKTKEKVFLNSEGILKYFLNNSEELDTMIMCKTPETEIVTTDFNVYEALGSLKPYDDFKINKLVKFFEAVIINPGDKKVLTHERVEELRKLALKKVQEN